MRDFIKPGGLKAFAGEIAIIVLGVGIALGAGEVVDDWNWQKKIKAQKGALDADVLSMWGAMSARVIMQPCIDRRLGELSLVFDRKERGVPLGIVAPIGRPVVWTGGEEALRMATADGSLSHMRLADKKAYFGVSSTYRIFAGSAEEERASWRTLQGLNEASALDDVDWRELRRAYRDAVDSNRSMIANMTAKGSGAWLQPFTSFPRFPANRETLTLPNVTALCRNAVLPDTA